MACVRSVPAGESDGVKPLDQRMAVRRSANGGSARRYGTRIALGRSAGHAAYSFDKSKSKTFSPAFTSRTILLVSKELNLVGMSFGAGGGAIFPIIAFL